MAADTTFGKIQLMDDAQPFLGMELKRFRKELSNLSIRDLGFSPGLSLPSKLGVREEHF